MKKNIFLLVFIFGIFFQMNAQDRPFITTWNTNFNSDNIIYIPTEGTGYDYSVDWGDGTIENNFTGNAMHTYAINGTYEVKITGDFPRIYFNSTTAIVSGTRDFNPYSIEEVKQWGDIQWRSMNNAFSGCDFLTVTATDAPDLYNVTDISGMFKEIPGFNAAIGNWDVSTITNMEYFLSKASSFNQNISEWDVSKVTNMGHMFDGAGTFNQDISKWNVSKVTNMANMFNRVRSFNQDISNWNVSAVTNMESMFMDARAFNQELSEWNVSKVTNMARMFENATAFNQTINTWDVSLVTNMNSMFMGAANFNQPLFSWNVSRVTDMTSMFEKAIFFNQNIGDWNVSTVANMDNMLNYTNVNATNYDKLLNGWGGLPTLSSNVTLGALNLTYCAGKTARNNIISTYNWKIFSDIDCNDKDSFITLWKTTSSLFFASDENQIKIPTQGTGYNYTIAWGDGTSNTGVTGEITHTYPNKGEYIVTISGIFPRIAFSQFNERSGERIPQDIDKILEVKQWGAIQWETFENAFRDCDFFNITATDAPNLTMVTNMANMFEATDLSSVANLSSWDVSTIKNMSNLFKASKFNGNISEWNVGNVTDMSNMFQFASFNQDITNWNVGNVANMVSMFHGNVNFNQAIGNWDMTGAELIVNMFRSASSFNQAIGNWNVSNVTDMGGLFNTSNLFNQDISKWDVSNVNSMINMFRDARTFNQDIANWDVSKVTSFGNIFDNAKAFDQNLGNWDIRNTIDGREIPGLNSCGLSTENYDKTLQGWAALIPLGLKLNSNGFQIFLEAEGLTYCAGKEARAALINFGWKIEGDTEDCTTLSLGSIIPVTKFEIYPNPAAGQLFVNLKTMSKNTTYTIFNLSGKRVLSGILSKVKNPIFVETLRKGIYIIQVNGTKNTYTSKFVKI